MIKVVFWKVGNGNHQDAPDADYEKNPSAYVITHRTVKKGDVLKLKQARGGGFAVSLMAK